MDDIYYSLDKLMSYNFILAFCLGERGTGKTFASKCLVLKKFLKTGEQFIYLRRYKKELKPALATFWSDLQENGFFEDYDLEVKKSDILTEFKCNGKVCGYGVALSTSNILKSTAFPLVKTIIFDEYMIDNAGTYRYLKNEVTMMLDIIETVGRMRDIQVIFLGNHTSFYGSPYTAYFNLELPYNNEFRTFKDGTIVVNYIKNLKYREEKKKTRFYKVISGTDYAKYAVDNESLIDNFNFIAKKPDNAEFWCIFVINNEKIGVWNGRDGCIYLSNKYDPNTSNKFAFDFNDHTESTVFLNARENYYLRLCVKCYKQGLLKFENQKIKAVILPLLNKCIAF